MRTVEGLALALTHPASPVGWFEGWSALRMLHTELTRALDKDSFAAAVVRALLNEFEDES